MLRVGLRVNVRALNMTVYKAYSNQDDRLCSETWNCNIDDVIRVVTYAVARQQRRQRHHTLDDHWPLSVYNNKF
jgi:hypothetical protein